MIAAAAASAPVTPYIYRYSTSSMSLRRTSLVRGWAQASAGKPEAIDFTLDQGISLCGCGSGLRDLLFIIYEGLSAQSFKFRASLGGSGGFNCTRLPVLQSSSERASNQIHQNLIQAILVRLLGLGPDIILSYCLLLLGSRDLSDDACG